MNLSDLSVIALAGILVSPPLSAAGSAPPVISSKWETVECTGKPHARHEAAFIAVGSGSRGGKLELDTMETLVLPTH